MRAEGVSGIFQFFTDLAVIVNFTVESDGVSTIIDLHRLVPCRGNVQDGEAPVSQTDDRAAIRRSLLRVVVDFEVQRTPLSRISKTKPIRPAIADRLRHLD